MGFVDHEVVDAGVFQEDSGSVRGLVDLFEHPGLDGREIGLDLLDGALFHAGRAGLVQLLAQGTQLGVDVVELGLGAQGDAVECLVRHDHGVPVAACGAGHELGAAFDAQVARADR